MQERKNIRNTCRFIRPRRTSRTGIRCSVVRHCSVNRSFIDCDVVRWPRRLAGREGRGAAKWNVHSAVACENQAPWSAGPVICTGSRCLLFQGLSVFDLPFTVGSRFPRKLTAEKESIALLGVENRRTEGPGRLVATFHPLLRALSPSPFDSPFTESFTMRDEIISRQSPRFPPGTINFLPVFTTISSE